MTFYGRINYERCRMLRWSVYSVKISGLWQHRSGSKSVNIIPVLFKLDDFSFEPVYTAASIGEHPA
jgi:hypothetical protein